MRSRSLGKTSLRVSEMALGTWGLSGDAYGPVDEAEQRRVLSRALDMGFTLFETSDAYGAGRMEGLLGRVFRERCALAAPGREPGVVVVTKGGIDRSTAPARKRFDAAYLRARVDASLARLGRDRIDVYLLHGPSLAAVAGDEAIGAMRDMQREGKIAHWGVSAGDVATGRTALRKGAEVIELAYNLIHPTDLHRLAGEIMVAGAGVLARSTLAYGLLAGTWTREREFAPGDHRADRWTKLEFERRLDQIEALRFLLGRDIRTLTSAAVRFVLSNALVSCAVLGPRSVDQLEDLVREVGMGPVYLREADLTRLPRALEAIGVEP